jgi:hypothetical protein
MMDELKLNKLAYFLVFAVEAVLVAAFFLLFIEINYSYSTTSAFGKIDITNVYVNLDRTSPEQMDSFWENEDESIKKARELYDYATKGRTKYSYWEYEIGTLANGKQIFQATTDKYFFDLYSINVATGRNLYDAAERKNDITPVVIGADLTEKYQLGDVIEMNDPNTNAYTTENVKYEIVGILPKGTTYPAPYNIGVRHSLDDRMFRPLDADALNDFANLNMAISSLVIKTDNETDLRQIEQFSNDLNLLHMGFEKVSDNLATFVERGKENTQICILIILAFITLTVLAGGIAIYTVTRKKLPIYIARMQDEFSVKKLCLNVFSVLCVISAVLLLLSVLCVMLLGSLLSFSSYYDFSVNPLINVLSYTFAAVTLLAINAAIALIPYVKLRGVGLTSA